MTAYLVVHFDVDARPARVVEARIYSEPSWGLTMVDHRHLSAATVLTAHGDTYAEAKECLLANVLHPVFGKPFEWLRPLLDGAQ